MPLHVDVQPRIPENFAELVADGVKTGIRDALIQISADLSLSEDERLALDKYRAHKARNVAAAKQLVTNVTKVVDGATLTEYLAHGQGAYTINETDDDDFRQTYNVTRG